MPCVAVGHVVISVLRNFSYQGLGGWEKVSLPGGLKWGSVTLLVMDLVVHAAAFGLGVKRSAIQFPWERPPLNGIFAKRPRLISPPVLYLMQLQMMKSFPFQWLSLSERYVGQELRL